MQTRRAVVEKDAGARGQRSSIAILAPYRRVTLNITNLECFDDLVPLVLVRVELDPASTPIPDWRRSLSRLFRKSKRGQ